MPAAGVRSHSIPKLYFSSQQQILSETCRHLEKQRGKIKVKVNYRDEPKVRSGVDLSWLNYHFNFIPWQLQHLPLNWWKERHVVCSELTFSSKRVGAGLRFDESALFCISFLQMYSQWLTPALTLHSNGPKPARNRCDTNKWQQRSLWFPLFFKSSLLFRRRIFYKNYFNVIKTNNDFIFRYLYTYIFIYINNCTVIMLQHNLLRWRNQLLFI